MILKKFEPQTGKSRHLLEVSKRLCEQGHEVVLVTNKVLWDGAKEDLAHLKIHEVGGSQNSIYFREKQILAILEKENVDVIELHGGLTMSLFARRYARHATVPMVLNIHSQPTDLFREYKHLSLSDLRHDRKYIIDVDDFIGLGMRMMGYLRFWKHPKIRGVIVPSQKLKARYADIDYVYWVPSGADLKKYSPSRELRQAAREELAYKEHDSVVLFFSRAVMVRGMDTLIHACERLSADIPGLRLVFYVLSDVDEARLKRMIGRSSISNRIDIHVGRNPKMPKALQAADVCAFPFRTTGCIPEQPLTVLEAMATEKAVISTTVGSLPEIISDREDGMLVPPNDPEALAIALREVLLTRHLREKLEVNARKKVDTMYNWDTITTQTIEVYEKAVS